MNNSNLIINHYHNQLTIQWVNKSIGQSMDDSANELLTKLVYILHVCHKVHLKQLAFSNRVLSNGGFPAELKALQPISSSSPSPISQPQGSLEHHKWLHNQQPIILSSKWNSDTLIYLIGNFYFQNGHFTKRVFISLKVPFLNCLLNTNSTITALACRKKSQCLQ